MVYEDSAQQRSFTHQATGINVNHQSYPFHENMQSTVMKAQIPQQGFDYQEQYHQQINPQQQLPFNSHGQHSIHSYANEPGPYNLAPNLVQNYNTGEYYNYPQQSHASPNPQGQLQTQHYGTVHGTDKNFPPNFTSPSQNQSNLSNFLPNIPLNNTTAQLGLQIGGQIMNAGTQYVNLNYGKVQGTIVKTYFNVTNIYVLRKLLLIVFPFRHRNWMRGILRDAAGQPVGFLPPREDINAVDLYIPLMACVTFILLKGVILGLNKSFKPEYLGIHASTSILFIVSELLLVKLVAYLLAIADAVKTLDVLAITGYNFFPLTITLIGQIFAGRIARYVVFAYTSLAMAIFMLRSLRHSFLPDQSQSVSSVTGGDMNDSQIRRRRRNFLLAVVFVQILCSYLLLL